MNYEYGPLVNGTNRAKSKYWEYSMFQCHLVIHKSHMYWPEIESMPPR